MARNEILSIFQNCLFDQYDGELSEQNFEYKIIDQLPYNLSYTVETGASKLVIIPDGANYVIKIPFNGMWEERFDDEEEEEYTDFYKFEGASYGDGWDYCLNELIIYRLSKTYNINEVFVKTKYLGSINNYPIYIQERAVTFCESDKRREKTLKDIDIKTEDTCRKHNFYTFNKKWLSDALEYYGEKKLDKIISFLSNNNIGDLHNSNIGYVGNRPVLIDFSDFCD